MTRVLVVDDEFLVCSYLRQLIDWETQGCCIVGQAGNGREAMEKVKELKPDLIFLDVSMPEMDGIEFIRYLHTEYPHIRVIILSSYSDYHYVRETMKFGARDYLLKDELQPENLIRILKLLSLDQELPVHVPEENSWRLLRDTGIRRFFETGAGKVPESLAGIRKPVIAAARLNLVAASSVPEGDAAWEESHLLRQILATCAEICDQDEGARIVFMGGMRLVFLFPALPAEDLPSQEHRVDRCRGIIQDLLLKYYNVHLDWRYGGRIGDLSLIPQIYRQLLEQPAALSQTGNFHISINQELQLINAVEGKDRKSVERILAAVFPNVSKESQKPLKREFSILLGDMLSLTMKLYQENGVLFPETEQDRIPGVNMEKAHAWFLSLFLTLIDRLDNRSPFSWAVNSVIEYVRQHYKDDIGITDIGRHCGLNASYVGTIFKKETGIGLARYIDSVRIQAAVSLMWNQNVPPTQVYELVGFRNYNNFFNHFKELTGFCPKQFKEEAGADWISRFHLLDKHLSLSVL